MASDGAGEILSSTNPTGGAAAWKAVRVDPGRDLAGVACTSVSLCLAVGGGPVGGQLFSSTHPTGAASEWKPVQLAVPSGLLGASCPSASLCVAFDGGGDVATSTDPTGGTGAWTVTNLDPRPVTGLSCPSVSLCVGVDIAGRVLSSTDPAGGSGAWATTAAVPDPDGSPSEFLDLSCPSASMCAAVDFTGNVATSTDPTGGAQAWESLHVDGGNGLVGLSCPSESFCAAVDDGGYFLGSTGPAVGPAWRPVRMPDRGADAVSCPSASLCVVGDGDGSVQVSTDPLGGPSSWTVLPLFPAPSGGDAWPVTSVSCPSRSFCVAIGYGLGCGPPAHGCWPFPPAYVATSSDPNGGRPAWHVTTLKETVLSVVSCPSPSLCVAGGPANTLLTSTDPSGEASAWKPVRFPAVPPGYSFTGISCASAHLCVAVERGGNALTSTNPTGGSSAWRPERLTGGSLNPYGFLNSVSCPSGSLCVAVDNNGNAFTSTNPTAAAPTWHATRIDDNPVSPFLNSVSCPSTRLCVVADSAGDITIGRQAPPSPPSRSQIKALLTKELAPPHRCTTIHALLNNGGCTLSAKALTAGSLRIRWYYRNKRGARSGATASVLAARADVRFGTATVTMITIKLTPAGTRLLKHTGRLSITAEASFRPTHQPAITARRSFKLRP